MLLPWDLSRMLRIVESPRMVKPDVKSNPRLDIARGSLRRHRFLNELHQNLVFERFGEKAESS